MYVPVAFIVVVHTAHDAVTTGQQFDNSVIHWY